MTTTTMTVTIYGVTGDGVEYDRALDVTSPILTSEAEALDWVAETCRFQGRSVSRDSLRFHGEREIWVGGACQVLAILQRSVDLPHAPVSAAAIADDNGNGNCPTCQLGGVTPEHARLIAPSWHAALLTVALLPTPSEPAVCCTDCRQMLGAGLDPAAIIAPDHERERIGSDLVRWAGDDAASAHDDEVSTDERSHGMYCCESVRHNTERNMQAFVEDQRVPLESLRSRWTSELTDRTVERAKREGVLPTS